ncbi:MAG: hypothetical protein AUH92_00100 [Acidobacteria bacterium 13_1_40CM_4_69_4]|nr:MAG: hypothetical protein AUH92_00100 [Acidobacteria bacterium 13_1_40CM_4_69_4]
MIVVCPGCGRRYPPGAGRRVRCTACRRVFSVEEGPAAVTGRAAPLTLVGDEDREFRHLVRRTLESLGCEVEVTEDGEAAFRYAVARHPDLMVLNVYLQRLLGVAVCEGVKGSPDLRRTKVALVGSVFKSDRFVRNPGNLYGADDYFEDVIPEAQLRARLRVLLGGAAGSTRAPAVARAPASPQAAPSAPPAIDWSLGPGPSTAPATGPVSPSGADETIDPRSEIRRLARIMVSDLKIYHPDGFRKAVLERRFSETFREELTQAKELIGRRFPGVSDRMAVLTEALKEQIAEERAAASRGVAGPAP